MNNTKKLSFYTLAITGVTLLTANTFAQMPEFSDIGGREDREGIEYLKQRSIINGYEDGTFKPNQSITRAEFTKIALETANIPLLECSKNEVKNINTLFSDVTSKDWFAEYVCNAQKSGIINGYNNGTFKPNENINIAEAAKLIVLSQDNEFINLQAISNGLSNDSQWYEKYTTGLSQENAVKTENIQNANAPLTRGKMADIIWRLQTGKEITTTAEPILISSCTKLEKEIKKSKLRNNGGHFGRDFEFAVDESIAPMEKAISSAGASNNASRSSSDFSTTNIQEAGVDEADVVKNDGSHIFVARDHDVRIVKAYPQNEMQEDAVITLPDINITNLFLDENTLVVLGQKNNSGNTILYKMQASSHYNYSNFTELRVFDISDRKKPIQTRAVSIEGNIISSRKIEDVVYLITQNNIYNYTEDETLPQFSDNGAISRVAKCDQISYFPNFTDQTITTVSAIDVKNTDNKISFTNILGAGHNIYASAKNLFIINQDSVQKFIQEETDGETKAYWDWNDISRISKFSLDGTNVDFMSQAETEGTVLNQYSMSEHNDFFRIATHKNQNWRNEESMPENILTIFDKNLKKTGEITGIAPGENIKSVRFMGDRGFIVTFKTTDPLFAIDLSPYAPKILGELKIPGWSDYLHPIDENYLIGFGKEVSEEAIDAEQLTWDMLEGMKLSLFDISDLENPKELHTLVIGDRGTESEILRNPKALFFDANRKLIGFPIRIQKMTDNKYENVFTGAHLYSFDINTGFTLQGAVSHFPEYMTEYWDNSYIITRLVRIGDNMYSISKDMVKGLDMNLKKDSAKEVLFLKAGKCEEITDVSSCMNRSDCEPQWKPFPCDTGMNCIQPAIFDKCISL